MRQPTDREQNGADDSHVGEVACVGGGRRGQPGRLALAGGGSLHGEHHAVDHVGGRGVGAVEELSLHAVTDYPAAPGRRGRKK